MALFLSSRGTTIITQKENKGEYYGVQCNSKTDCVGGYTNSDSLWFWDNTSYDWNAYAHVFDQNGKNGTTNNVPIRYANNSTNYSTTDNIPQCTSDYSTTSGNTLYSETRITSQKSCNPHSYNAGNFYNFPAATAGSNNASTSSETDMPNSICPKGWRLPPNTGNKSYNTLIRTAYGISDTTTDTNLLANPAMAFVRLGNYWYIHGTLANRGNLGFYWSSTVHDITNSFQIFFHSGLSETQHTNEKADGVSIRCVSR